MDQYVINTCSAPLEGIEVCPNFGPSFGPVNLGPVDPTSSYLYTNMIPKSSLCLFLCMLAFPRPMFQKRFSSMRLVQQWTSLDYSFPTQMQRQEALDKRWFVPGVSVPIDLEVQYRKGLKSRIFVSVPRFDEGRAITLGVVGENGIIEPYPNYEWNHRQGQNCDGFTSVFRTAMDECNRLWVLDTGRVGANFSCSPQVLAFDLTTDRLVYRQRISAASIKPNSLLITPVVDVGATCDDVFLYLADVEAFGLVVVDTKSGRDWRVEHRLFYPYPNRGSFWIQGLGFDLMDGVFGLALSPRRSITGNRRLYFHALASTTENYVNTLDLKNSSNFIPDAPANMIQVFPGERDSQSAAEAIDNTGIMYFGLMEPPRLACWNTATEFRPENIHVIAQDNDNLQFISGLKVVYTLKGFQELWVMASGFQRVMNDQLFTNAPNFKILASNVEDLVRGTPCTDPKGYTGPRIAGNEILGWKSNI